MFTDEELEAAILRYLTTELETKRLAGGSRDVLGTKTQIYELISAAFLLRPQALFSVCWLASNGLRAEVAAQLVDMQAILDAAPAVSKASSRITSTTELYNAEASLVSLTASFSARSSGVAGSISPVIERFSASVERFIRDELAKNTIVRNEVVKTPEELQEIIAQRWKTAAPRHQVLVDRLAGLAGALENYGAVRLPDAVVGSLLVRVRARLGKLTAQMQAVTAPRDSRNAMLELLAMRTLLKQASRFKPPALRKAPLTGDAASGVLLGPSGLAACIVGAVSGPFNYAPGTVLSYSVGAVAGAVVLPGTSAAVLRSRVMVPYTSPPAGSECALVSRRGATVLAVPAWGSGLVAAAGLSGYADFTAAWNSTTQQLELTSGDVGDGTYLELLADTPARSTFAAWLLDAGSSRRANGVAVPSEAVVDALRSDARLVPAVIQQVSPGFVAQRSAVLSDVLIHRLVERTDLVGNGTSVVRALADLEALGVEPGMVLVTTAPLPAFWIIESVEGPALSVRGTVPTGTYAYYVSTDFTEVELGSRVYLTGSVDTGLYRVVLGGAKLTLDRPLRSSVPVQVTSIVSELVELKVREIGTASALTINPCAGATALGLAPQTVVSELSVFGLPIDLAARGIEVGNRLKLQAAAGTVTEHSITAVGGTSVEFTPPLPYRAGSIGYAIEDALVADFGILSTALFAVGARPAFADLAVLDQDVGRLARGARFNGSVAQTLSGYVAALVELLALCDSYVVERDLAVEQALRLMVEHGFDRAADLFVTLRLKEFFGLEADAVSYKTWFMRKIQEVARTAVPVSKDTQDPTSAWTTIAVQRAPSKEE